MVWKFVKNEDEEAYLKLLTEHYLEIEDCAALLAYYQAYNDEAKEIKSKKKLEDIIRQYMRTYGNNYVQYCEKMLERKHTIDAEEKINEAEELIRSLLGCEK